MTSDVQPSAAELVPFPVEDNLPEIWVSIPAHPEYQASSHGRIRSGPRSISCADGRTRRWPGKVLTPAIKDTGHQYVGLESRKRYYVHRLVLEAFVGPAPEGTEACHDNGRPGDNRPGNLRWDTRRSNMLDKQRHGTDHNRNKQCCRWGHELRAPNLATSTATLGHRACLACSRARSRRTWLVSRGALVDFKCLADQYYAEIVAGAGTSRPGAKPGARRCTATDCERSAVARGLCKKHWQRWSRARKTDALRGAA